MDLADKLTRILRPPKPAVYGHLDPYELGTVKGWSYDPGDPMARVSVELKVDGELVAAIAGDLHRTDLQSAGLGDGGHAFEFTLPQRFLDGKRHIVEGNIAESGEALKNSPMPVLTELFLQAPVQNESEVAPETMLGALSVVMVTGDRAQVLERTLRVSAEAVKELKVEFIVLHTGSDEETARVLETLSGEFPNVRWRKVEAGAESQARTIGVSMAETELILFQGDETEPATSDFYRHHLNAHRMLPSVGVAVLGSTLWPNSGEERISFLMSHLQGAGDALGFYNLTPYTWVDWRFFNTSNFSFKKSVAADWASRGGEWSAWEIGYRVNASLEVGWRVLYTPNAAIQQAGECSVRETIEKRTAAGRDARTFLSLYPDAGKLLGTEKVDALLAARAKTEAEPLEDLIRMMEGVQSWAVVIEKHYNLGSQNWHADLLTAVFEVSFLQGYVMSCPEPDANYGAAYRYVLERFQEKMAAAATFEVFGRFPGFPLT